MFTWVLGRYVASTVVIYYNPDFLEGADSVAGQLRGDKECPPSVASPVLAEFGGRCRKAMLGVCACPCKRDCMLESVARWGRGGGGGEVEMGVGGGGIVGGGGVGGGGEITDRVYRY